MSEPATSESEIAFLRSQVSTLSNRLCETLTQQVAQQQTVLIAAMQTNLALTQTVDRLNKVADRMAESLEREREGKETHTPGSDFGSLLASLVPHLIGATGQWRPDNAKNQQAPTPMTIQLPSEVVALMRNREAQAANHPINPASAEPKPAAKASDKKSRAKGA